LNLEGLVQACAKAPILLQLQVFEHVSEDLVMEVLRSTSGNMAGAIFDLPQALRHLAVLTECPSLASTCVPVDQMSEATFECTHPTLTVCASPIQSDKGSNQEAPTTDAFVCATSDQADSCSRSKIWLSVHEITLENGLDDYTRSLQHNTQTVCGRLQVKHRDLQGLSMKLPSGRYFLQACVVFGPGDGDVHVRDARFEGAQLVN
jgi:hypothetical protein